MKYFYYVLAIAFSIQSSHSQIVDIYDTNFKEALIASGIDTNGDNEIQITEAKAVTSLDVSSSGVFDPFKMISNLSGIEHFTNLELLNISFNEIRDLDISALTNLKTLLCERNNLENLDISMLSNLKKLNCYQNRLTTLSLNNSLLSLEFGSNRGLGLDFIKKNESKLINLTVLRSSSNNLTKIDVSPFLNLEELYLYNNSLTELDVSRLTKLKKLTCHYNKLTSLDVSNLKKLIFLNCNDNELTTLSIKNDIQNIHINFDNNPNLEYICCDALEVSTIQDLVNKYGYINCEVSASCDVIAKGINIPDANFKNRLLSNGIDLNNDGEIQVSEAEKTTSLPIFKQGIKSLEGIQYFVNLTRLTAYDNLITTVDLSALKKLRVLSINNNNLTSIDLSLLTNLEYVYIHNNNLSSLNVDTLTNIKQIDCSYNPLTTLDVTKQVNMVNLNCSSGNLTSLNLGNLNYLDVLGCDHNKLTELDLTGVPNLTRLSCNTNQLTSLNLNNLSKLENFICQVNPLTTLDFSKLTKIKYLTCGYSNLSIIDVSNLSKLEHLVCGNIPNLTKIILKNNNLESKLYFPGCPKLSSICCDALEVSTVQDLVNKYGYTNCEVSASCGASTKITNVDDTNFKKIGTNLNNDGGINNIIKLFPNPSVNNILIQSKEPIELISLYDISGRLIKSTSYMKNKTNVDLNISNLLSGTYIIKVKTNQREFTNKVIKK